MAQIKVKDISMYYEIHGRGEPIVFIGGFTADHIIWSAIVDHLKDRYQIILFDNRGAGQTDVPDGPYSIEQMADDVLALCTALEITRAHFVGSSMGGFILQMLSLRHPELVKSATISNSVSSMQTSFKFYVDAQYEMRKAKVADEILIKAACSWTFSYQFISQPGMIELLIQMGIRNPYPFTEKGYAGQYPALMGFDSSTWANKIDVPVLVLGADQDLIFREPVVRQLANLITGARYYCFEECGHLPAVEHPKQFARVVDEFISSL